MIASVKLLGQEIVRLMVMILLRIMNILLIHAEVPEETHHQKYDNLLARELDTDYALNIKHTAKRPDVFWEHMRLSTPVRAPTFIIGISLLNLFGQDGFAQTYQASGTVVVGHVQHSHGMLGTGAGIQLVPVQIVQEGLNRILQHNRLHHMLPCTRPKGLGINIKP